MSNPFTALEMNNDEHDPAAHAFAALYEKVLKVEEKLGYLVEKVDSFEADAKKMGEMFSPDKLPELLTQILGGGF